MAKRIGEILVDAGAVTKEQVKEALEVQKERGGKLCQVLISLGHLTEDALLDSLANQPGMTSVSIEQYAIDAELRQYVPKEYALRHEMMPLDKLGKNLTVAMAVPLDEETKAELEKMTGLQIRAVLCGRGTVQRTIEQYYGSADAPAEATGAEMSAAVPEQVTPGPEAVRLRGVVDLIASVDQFPVLLDVHVRVMDRLEDPEVTVVELTELIETDPALSANVLKVANSAAYAARSEFDSVQRAIAYLGLRTVGGIVTGAAVLSQLQAAAYFDLSRLFQHALCSAMLTKIICDTGRLGDYDVAFTAGLLANIGHIALSLLSQQRMDRLHETQDDTDLSPVEAQEEAFGISASEIGYHLAQHWNLPESLGNVIRFHDRLDQAPEEAQLIVAVALAQTCLERDETEGTLGTPATDPALATLLERLGLSPAALITIQDRYYEGLDSLPSLEFGQG